MKEKSATRQGKNKAQNKMSDLSPNKPIKFIF